MHGSELLAQVKRCGARVGFEGGRLYVESASQVPPAVLDELGAHKAEVLGLLAAYPQRLEHGRTIPHPWRGRLVDSPAGRGRLIWTDGYRAAVSTEPDVAYFVDLTDVRIEGE